MSWVHLFIYFIHFSTFIDSFDHGHDHSHGGALMHSQELAVYLLEIGIASHSIIIGIALGATRSDFIPLLVALTFHQFFEGIALSSVVIEAEFKKRIIAISMVIFCNFLKFKILI